MAKSTKKSTKRVSLAEPADKYLLTPRTATFSTGCLILDCVLGGGWAYGRIFNVVGDRSAGKTLIAIEACANFANKYKEGRIEYVETESAFDKPYAQSLGLPLDRVTFPEGIFTVEDLHTCLVSIIENAEGPTLVVVDSLDALSDKAELSRDIGDASYGANKAKMLSQMFRRIVQKMSGKDITLLVVSQVRENMNAGPFGRKWTRSGGKALDFYCSQIIHLQHKKRLERTSKSVKRAIGVEVKIKCEKNKVGPPFRECEFPIYFGYGIEDLEASLGWLVEVKVRGGLADSLDGLKKLAKDARKMDAKAYAELQKRVRGVVLEAWTTIESSFEIGRRKYGSEETSE